MTRKELRRRVATLRKLVAQATDLNEPFRYFSQNLGNRVELLDQSKPVRPEQLSILLASLATHYLQRSVILLNPMFLRFGKLVHGTCTLNGQAYVLYFVDIEVGILSVPVGGSIAALMRFSDIDAPLGSSPFTSKRGQA